MKLQYPVEVSTIIAALPHRPPMVWIDEVYAGNASAGTCAIRLGPGRLDVDPSSGLCTAFAPVEWIAEAFGYSRACVAREQGEDGTIKRAFLVGVSELELSKPIEASGRIFVDWRLTREMAPLALVDGTIRRDDDVLARAKLKLYFET
jgi:predicted hotdog family 3-hydroxylacyl-ACP dehydratase